VPNQLIERRHCYPAPSARTPARFCLIPRRDWLAQQPAILPRAWKRQGDFFSRLTFTLATVTSRLAGDAPFRRRRPAYPPRSYSFEGPLVGGSAGSFQRGRPVDGLKTILGRVSLHT